MKLESPVFRQGAMIPKKYTCDGEDISPSLQWAEVPPRTRSLALTCDDPDAPIATWVHWVAYAIQPNVSELKEAVQKVEVTSSGMKQGRNSWRRIGYGGPCPPVGRPHRYFFRLYALDIELPLKPGAEKQDLERAMKGHVLAEAETMGIYARE